MEQRFRDNAIVQDLEQMGLRVDGMPEAGAPTIAHVSNEDVRHVQCRDIRCFFSQLLYTFSYVKGTRKHSDVHNSLQCLNLDNSSVGRYEKEVLYLTQA